MLSVLLFEDRCQLLILFAFFCWSNNKSTTKWEQLYGNGWLQLKNSFKMFHVSIVPHRTKSRASTFVFLCVCVCASVFNLHRIFINSKFISPWLIRETEKNETLLLIGNIKRYMACLLFVYRAKSVGVCFSAFSFTRFHQNVGKAMNNNSMIYRFTVAKIKANRANE